MVIDSIYELIKNEYNMVGYHHVKLKEVPMEVISNYKRVYQEIEFIVTSLRIDTVISRLIGTSRENIKKYFNEDDIILNYEVCHKINYNLTENDIFSIRKHGKYKFIGIVKESKKGNYIIKCLKYIDK